jgi:hypothetical protein
VRPRAARTCGGLKWAEWLVAPPRRAGNLQHISLSTIGATGSLHVNPCFARCRLKRMASLCVDGVLYGASAKGLFDGTITSHPRAPTESMFQPARAGQLHVFQDYALGLVDETPASMCLADCMLKQCYCFRWDEDCHYPAQQAVACCGRWNSSSQRFAIECLQCQSESHQPTPQSCYVYSGSSSITTTATSGQIHNEQSRTDSRVYSPCGLLFTVVSTSLGCMRLLHYI